MTKITKITSQIHLNYETNLPLQMKGKLWWQFSSTSLTSPATNIILPQWLFKGSTKLLFHSGYLDLISDVHIHSVLMPKMDLSKPTQTPSSKPVFTMRRLFTASCTVWLLIWTREEFKFRQCWKALIQDCFWLSNIKPLNADKKKVIYVPLFLLLQW